MEECATIHDLHDAFHTSRVGPEAVFRRAVERARAAHDEDGVDARNEWIYVVSEAEADAQLRALRKRDTGLPLFGVPFAVKDNIDVAGVPTTVGCGARAYTPSCSADAVRRLQDAGAMFVGKTNLDQFATGLTGTRSPYGVVPSAWVEASLGSKALVGGGSSSGSASVVARGIVPFALGTDTAGSGRVPAAFNGVVGLKPSVGRVSTDGVYPACPSIDCVSIFALTAADAARVLRVIECDREDPRAPPAGPRAFQPKLRVGVPWAWPETRSSVSCDDFRERFDSVKTHVGRRDGVELVDFDMGVLSDIGAMLYEGAWLAERYTSVADALQTPEVVDPTVYRILKDGNRFSGTDVFEAMGRLAKRRVAANEMWSQLDLILVPTTPHHPTIEQVEAEPILANADLGTFNNFVNFLGWCAVAVPFVSDDDTPFGYLLIAPPGYDVALLDLAKKLRYNKEQTRLGAPQAGLNFSGDSLAMPSDLPHHEDMMEIAVVGAHLHGMPLHHELEEARAIMGRVTTTSCAYRLYALNTTPPKPALVRDEKAGERIEIEVYHVPRSRVGEFLCKIPHPLGLGKVECYDKRCDDKRWVTGFIAEPCAVVGSEDVTKYGGWRNAMRR